MRYLCPRCSNREETRQYSCCREFACRLWHAWHTKRISSFFDDIV